MSDNNTSSDYILFVALVSCKRIVDLGITETKATLIYVAARSKEEAFGIAHNKFKSEFPKTEGWIIGDIEVGIVPNISEVLSSQK